MGTRARRASVAERRLKRRARRWLDLLAVLSSNGRPEDRWPCQKLVTIDATVAIREEALIRLERINPALFDAVQVLQGEAVDRMIGITYRQFQVQAAINTSRLSRMRRAIRRVRIRAGLADQVY